MMDNFKKNIDKLVSKILTEEIEKKSQQLSEELHGKQEKLDVAEPKGKLTAADFKKLSQAKKHKKEVEEYYFEDEFYDDEDESIPGDYEGDESAEDEAEELSAQEPTYVGKGLKDNKPGKLFGSFDDDHGWFDERDREHTGDFDFDFDEEEFDDFDDFYSKHGENQMWFDKGDAGKVWFDRYKNKYQKPFRVRIAKGLEESETEEGNAFSGALVDAKKQGKDSFEVDGKKYQVKEAEEKWIQKTKMKKGALHKKLGIPEGDKIPKSKLNKIKKELTAKAEGNKKLSAEDSKLLKQVNLALTLGGIKESKNTLRLTEDELVEMIENIVMEQVAKETKEEKTNIDKKIPTGLKKTEDALGKSKKFNDNYLKSLVDKMKGYLKDGSKVEFSENPTDFPKSNYQGDKDAKAMKYTPSEAVDEYIDAFSYPGQTNLRFDEIKPDDKKIDKYLKGDKTTGNAEVDEDGKALGNVVPSKVGDKFKKNYDENLFGAEQADASYKRQPQPVDVAGDGQLPGNLPKKGKNKSTAKASKILNQLESTEDKKTNRINEDMEKMKNLISYNRKTQ